MVVVTVAAMVEEGKAAVRGAHRLLSAADEEMQGVREAAHAWLADMGTPQPWPASSKPWMVLDACVALKEHLREHNASLRAHNATLRQHLNMIHPPQSPSDALVMPLSHKPPSPGSVSGASDRSEQEH